MKKIMLLALGIALSKFSFGQEDSVVLRSISDDVLRSGTAYQQLEVLCKQIGHRLSGSVGEQQAQMWAEKALLAAGADTVYRQPVMVPKWVRGKESLKIKVQGNKQWLDVPMLSLGNSEGTKGKSLKGEIIVFDSFEALKSAKPQDVTGKIVFLNQAWPEHFPCTFDAYEVVGKNRYSGSEVASLKGAIAFIIRSLSTGIDDLPHTGVTSYGKAANKIPSLAVGNKTADALQSALKVGKASAEINSNCGMEPDVLSYNIIGVKNTSAKNIITVGAHYDSWDVGEGAHDDGAGCVQAIEVMASFNRLNLPVKNQLRVVLFANEENGARGGNAYADSALAKKEQHILALESDAGGFTPRGFSLTLSPEWKTKIKAWQPLFQYMGIYDFEREGGGVDIDPLHRKMGVSVVGLYPDTQRYFDVHHCAKDVFEAVNARELHLGAAAMAQFIYLVDKYASH